MPPLPDQAVARPLVRVEPEGLGDRRTGLLLILIGCLPFAAGALYDSVGGSGLIAGTCPFLEVTGLPCPLCGSTRAFAFLTSGDSGFLNYNAFWVLAAGAVIVTGLLLIFSRISLRGFWARRDNLAYYLLTATILSAWIWAVANRGAIAVS